MISFPIHGSIINPKARLYKKFIYDLTASPHINPTTPTQEITYQGFRYRSFSSFKWVEATETQEGQWQPLQGLTSSEDALTIKLNGRHFAKKGDSTCPECGDIVELNKSYYIIEDGIQKIRHKTLKNMATIYLPLKRLF